MDQPNPPEIVMAAHRDLGRVKEMLAQDSALLNMLYEPWSETPLGAASHVGNRPIAEFLLEQGAPLTITTAAMLGRMEEVSRFLEEDPDQANATGAHGISLLFHAALSGQVAIAEKITAAGGRTESAGHALHAAVSGGHAEMVSWLLAQGANPHILNLRGQTPLAAAEESGQEEIADMLRTAGGSPTNAEQERR